MNKQQIINYLIRKYNLKSYLEISTPTTSFVYPEIICDEKTIVCYGINQPKLREDIEINELSLDEYKNMKFDKKFDIIFVDPYHSFNQSYYDIELAYSLLSENGFIVVHDCYTTIRYLLNPDYQYGAWCGETYKAFLNFNINHPEYLLFIVDCDFGCGIISKNKKRRKLYNIKLDDITLDKFLENTGDYVILLNENDFYLHY